MNGTHVGRRAWISLFLLAAWLVLATQLVPSLIVSAYDKSSLPFFNALIIGRDQHALSAYLQYWRNITWLGGVWCLAYWIVGPLTRWMTGPRFFERAGGAATPGTLGAIRSWTCAILFVMTLWEDLASSSLLPRGMARPKGLLHLFHAVPIGFDRFLADAGALWTFEHLTAVLLLLGVLGLGTRIVVPAAAFCYFVMAGILREYAWFYHTGIIPLYALTVLSFTPCGDGWSLDRLIRIARGTRVPPADAAQTVYGWSRYLVWTVVAVPYVAAGLSKLYYGGIGWLNANNMLATLLRTTLAPMEFDWRLSLHLVHGPGVVLVMLGAVGLFTELLFGLTLVSPIARRVLPAAMLVTHVGILFLQNILFPDLILLQAVFYDFSPLRRAAGRWLSGNKGPAQVFYDGRCELCGRTILILRGFDVFDRLAFLDFRTVDLSVFRGKTRPEIDRSVLEHEIAVIDGDRLYTGFSAYRALAWRLPVCWFLIPLIYLPGARWVGDIVYKRVAARRHMVCEISVKPAAPPLDVHRVHLRGAVASLALTGFLLSWWMTHIEFYPLTTMKMFSVPNRVPGKITYVKPMAIYEDGRQAPARFERWIGAMADSRYRQIISVPFERASDLARCNEFLDASIRAANRESPPGSRVVAIELQSWEWDFVADADNPNHGHLVDTYVYHAANPP